MINKKSILKNISIFLCLVPMLVLSLFCLVPKKELKNVAAADEVLTNFSFIGSNVMVPVTLWNNGTTFDRNAFVSLSFTFSLNNGIYAYGISGVVSGTNYSSVSTGISDLNTISITSNDFAYNGNLYTGRMVVSNAPTYGFSFSITRSGNISRNINMVRFSNGSDGGDNYNIITYYDNTGNYISFAVDVSNNSALASNFLFQERTYYINLDFLDDNTYYEAGYTDGYNQGVTDGSSGGYNDGYKAGETIGYQNGYNAGVEHGGNYSFMGLIGAVIDAPVSAFTSLLNFELLGVNILGFISGLLTLALIIFIIKLCMGGK